MTPSLTPSVTQLAVQASLRQMVKQGHFSICAIDEILRLTNVIPRKDSYQLLRTLHCVHFSDMPRELLERMPGLISDCINGPSLDINIVFSRPAPVIITLTEVGAVPPEPSAKTPTEKPRRKLFGLLGSTS